MYAIVSHGIRLHLTHFRAEPIAVGIAAFVVAAAVMVAYGERPGGPLNPPLVRVSAVTWMLGPTALSPLPGFEAHPGTMFTLVLKDTNCGAGCATINFTTASVSPTSFSVVRAILPVILPGATGNLTVAFETPAGAYSGPLTVVLD